LIDNPTKRWGFTNMTQTDIQPPPNWTEPKSKYKPVFIKPFVLPESADCPWNTVEVGNGFVTTAPGAVRQTVLSGGDATYSSGAIDYIELPRDWVESKSFFNNLGTYGEFAPPRYRDDGARIQIFEQGERVHEVFAEAFSALLCSLDTVLSMPDVVALGAVLGNKKDPREFRIDCAWTRSLNGRRTLFVEGEFIVEQVRVLSVIIDQDWSGSSIQEISLVAPRETFDCWKTSFEYSLQTIRWQ
jgi:hypothetical protein